MRPRCMIVYIFLSICHATNLHKKIDEITVKEFTIRTNVSDHFAETVVLTRIYNNLNISKQFTFSVILPNSAYISGFLMDINGTEYKSFVEEKEKAKVLYNVTSSQSSAHGGFSVRNSNQFDVTVNTEPKTNTTFRLFYEELLERQKSQYEIISNIFPKQMVENLKVEIFIKENKKLSFVKVPGTRSTNSEVDIKIDKNVATVKYNPSYIKQLKLFCESYRKNKFDGLAAQFIVQYDLERDNNSEMLLADGYFIYFFAPTNLEPILKHVVFIIDTSGSMKIEERLNELKDAMKALLPKLQSEDILSIVSYNGAVRVWDINKSDFETFQYFISYAEGLVPKLSSTAIFEGILATEENINKAITIINKLKPFGATNTIGALEVGLHICKKSIAKYKNKYQPYIIFLSDGEPNVGLSDTEEIKIEVKKMNTLNIPIYTISIGEMSNRKFLRGLATINGGTEKHIYAGSDKSMQFQSLIDEIFTPVLSNLNFGNLSNSNTPLYFNGSEIQLVGKGVIWKLSNQTNNFKITGKGRTGILEFKPTINLPVTKLEKLWAYLTVKQLLLQREADPSNKEYTKKATKISLSYSLVTEVTSLIVVKPNETSLVNIVNAFNETNLGSDSNPICDSQDSLKSTTVIPTTTASFTSIGTKVVNKPTALMTTTTTITIPAIKTATPIISSKNTTIPTIKMTMPTITVTTSKTTKTPAIKITTPTTTMITSKTTTIPKSKSSNPTSLVTTSKTIKTSAITTTTSITTLTTSKPTITIPATKSIPTIKTTIPTTTVTTKTTTTPTTTVTTSKTTTAPTIKITTPITTVTNSKSTTTIPKIKTTTPTTTVVTSKMTTPTFNITTLPTTLTTSKTTTTPKIKITTPTTSMTTSKSTTTIPTTKSITTIRTTNPTTSVTTSKTTTTPIIKIITPITTLTTSKNITTIPKTKTTTPTATVSTSKTTTKPTIKITTPTKTAITTLTKTAITSKTTAAIPKTKSILTIKTTTPTIILTTSKTTTPKIKINTPTTSMITSKTTKIPTTKSISTIKTTTRTTTVITSKKTTTPTIKITTPRTIMTTSKTTTIPKTKSISTIKTTTPTTIQTTSNTTSAIKINTPTTTVTTSKTTTTIPKTKSMPTIKTTTPTTTVPTARTTTIPTTKITTPTTTATTSKTTTITTTVATTAKATTTVSSTTTTTDHPLDFCFELPSISIASNSTKMWYYDPRTGKCSNFFYNGGVSQNRFTSKEDCKSQCIKMTGFGTCSLPKDKGPCSGNEIRWYFDGQKCETFIYGGCMGNKNNFGTKKECNVNCRKNFNLEYCQLPLEPGNCAKAVPKWYYNGVDCSKFLYTGCGGNKNRFKSKKLCEEKCKIEAVSCGFKKHVGNCMNYEVKWFYDFENGVCREFWYGGCGGNKNNFNTQIMCEKQCVNLTTLDRCNLPKVGGRCKSRGIKQYYFNYRAKKCLPFYLKCNGNTNNFFSVRECLSTCL